MDFQLNDNEQAFAHSVSQIVQRYREGPRDKGISAAVHARYSKEFYGELHDGGFFGAAREGDFGLVCAVLLIEETAKSPFAVEVGASALIAPLTASAGLRGPFAIVHANGLARPIRFLPFAKTLLIVRGADLLALDIDADTVAANGGMYAYPFGTFPSAPDLGMASRIGDGAAALNRWRLAIAAEGAGLMHAALEFTVEYVKNRRQFGRPIGSFQAVKHRLAADVQQVRGAIWLVRRAAWSGKSEDIAMATLYVQHCIPAIVYDCHQFNGAMGMTLECPLHFWTYRLKALQGELGGWAEQGRTLAQLHWAD